MKSCFLIGHRDTPESIYPLLLNAVDFATTVVGIKEFIVGHYGLFDHMAAKAVLTLKRSDPELSLFLLLPYHPAERPIQAPIGFDGTFYPPGMESVPRRSAIVRANEYMADHVDLLIAYACHPASNARNLVEYAQRSGKPIINISHKTPISTSVLSREKLDSELQQGFDSMKTEKTKPFDKVLLSLQGSLEYEWTVLVNFLRLYRFCAYKRV